MCLVLPYSVPSLVAALTVVSKDIQKRYKNTTSFLKKVKPTPLWKLYARCQWGHQMASLLIDLMKKSKNVDYRLYRVEV